ncbi:MAG: cytochrome c biogenesis protein ResB [Candidatus Omnitrophica bacterium]|nr:cytochrome c biogenesis protein ResB [Candidatus Omnitrophota bacterium]
MKRSLTGNPVWKALGSVRLTLVLLWAIIAVSFAGALLPAESQPLVYSSVWFFCLLGAFALNLLVCSIDRLFFHRAKIASAVTHASVLVILLGCLMSAVFGFRGSMELSEGQSSDEFMAAGGARELPFIVTLEDFSLEWYETAHEGYPMRARVENADFVGKYLAQPGTEYQLGDTGYSFSVLQYIPHFVFDQDHTPVSRSPQPLNPAVLVRVTGPTGAGERWVFSLHPDIEMGGDPNVRFRFDLEPHIKAYRSRVRVTDPQRHASFTADIKVNAPLSYRGYTLYQSRYDSVELSWTGLDVVYDPGVKIVFLGFILMNIGIIAIFYPKFKASLAPVRAQRND